MKIPTVLHALALLAIAASPLAAADSLQCYAYPVGGKPAGALSADLESYYQMRFDYAQKQGADMQKWQDTAMLVFRIKFHSLSYGNPTPDPKDGAKPDPKPVDTLSPRAFKAWAQILFTQYALYDYYNPKIRLDVPAETSDTFEGLATRTTLLTISKECFTGVVDPGGPNVPVNLKNKVRRRVVSGKVNTGVAFNIVGQKSTANIPPSASILFKK
jgi:hypothetical protein